MSTGSTTQTAQDLLNQYETDSTLVTADQAKLTTDTATLAGDSAHVGSIVKAVGTPIVVMRSDGTADVLTPDSTQPNGYSRTTATLAGSIQLDSSGNPLPPAAGNTPASPPAS